MNQNPAGPQPGIALFSFQKFRPFLSLAQDRGVALDAVLAEHCLSVDVLSDPDTRLPRLQCIAIIRRLVAEMADPLAGLHAAERFELKDMDLIGYIVEQYPDILSALQAVVGYASLVGDSSRAEISCADGEVKLSQWVLGDEPLLPELADYLLASSHRGVAQFAGVRLSALRVELARPRPRAAAQAAYRRFFGGEVYFEARRGALYYAEQVLRQARKPGDPRLAQLLHAQAEQRLADKRRAAASLAEQVQDHLRSLDDLSAAQPARIAGRLGMSERTLRRRLEGAGTSYREILDNVRRQCAFTLLEGGQLRVGEVATRLGFSDLTGFARAFRRWTGESPSAYQRAAANRSAPQRPSATANKPPSRAG